MNTLHRFTSMHSMPGLLAALLILAMPFHAQADVGVNVNLWHAYNTFYGQVTMSASSPDPVTYHRVESPNGEIWQVFGPSTNSGSYVNLGFTNLLNECTNGLWTLIRNVNHASAQTNTFSLSLAGVNSNLFGEITMVDPLSGATVSTNLPNLQWTSTSMLSEVYVQVREANYPYTFGGSATLPGTTTNWTPSTALSEVEQQLLIQYQSNNFAGATFNLVSGPAIPGWSASADLLSYLYSGFFVPGSGSALGDALDAPELTWTTGGDYGGEGWFDQSVYTHDTVDAAQSGSVLDDSASWIETTVEGPGTLSFYWNMYADYGDYFECTYSNQYDQDIEFSAEGNEGGSWVLYDSIYLEEGPNTIRWTFYNYDYDGNDEDAAFLDEVVYSPEFNAGLKLSILRVTSGGTSTFRLQPTLEDATQNAEVETPNAVSSGYVFPTLADVADECTNGLWTLYFNRGTGSEQQHAFSVMISALASNNLPLIDITMPVDGASGVSSNTTYAWNGPTNFPLTFVTVYPYGEPLNAVDSASLAPSATTWSIGSSLGTGTNRFSVNKRTYSYPGITFSNIPSIDNWDAYATLSSYSTSDFVVGADFIPMPVTILPPMLVGGDLGLSFISQSGATHLVQYSTNLVTGPWMPATNFPGDGTTNMITLPTTNPAAYFKVETE